MLSVERIPRHHQIQLFHIKTQGVDVEYDVQIVVHCHKLYYFQNASCLSQVIEQNPSQSKWEKIQNTEKNHGNEFATEPTEKCSIADAMVQLGRKVWIQIIEYANDFN